jgi:two-component system KDP operon response regulator KdpE
VIRAIRGWSNMPIIALSAHRDEDEAIAVLDTGADDCVPKPPAIGELLARVRALLRRAEPDDSAPVVHTAAFTVDLAARQVIRHGAGPDHAVRLTPTEWQVLDMLVRNPGKLISQQQLLHQIRGPAHNGGTSYLRVYLRQLRRKLEPDPARPRHLITEPHIGYRFQP